MGINSQRSGIKREIDSSSPSSQTRTLRAEISRVYQNKIQRKTKVPGRRSSSISTLKHALQVQFLVKANNKGNISNSFQ